MILFYSSYCNHCKMLIDNINRYDKEKKIKLVCIDDLISENIEIERKIESVPAFMILPSKELLYGKSVFDHLLLPGRGILTNNQNTRLDKPDKNEGNNSVNVNVPVDGINKIEDGEPMAFVLNGFNFSDNFSSIDDNKEECKDKCYNWDYISNDKTISEGIEGIKINDDDNISKKIPSLDELKKMRDNLKFD